MSDRDRARHFEHPGCGQKSSSSWQETALVSFVKILEYVKYTNITFPPRLQKLAASKARNILSLRFGPEMPVETKALFREYSLPQIFQQYGLPSSFTVNFWSEIIMWIIVAAVGLFLQHHGKSMRQERLATSTYGV